MALNPNSAPQFWRHYDPQKGPIYQCWMGIRFFWSGLGLLRRSLKLQITSLVPVLLTVGVFGGLTYASASLTRMVLGLIPADVPGWLLSLVETFSITIVLLGLTFFLFFPVMTLISIPFREALAAQTEKLLTGQSSESSIAILQQILDLLRLVIFQILVLALLLALSWFVPGVGSLLSMVVLIFLAALDMVDPPLGQRGFLLPQKLAFVGQRQALMVGFGSMAFVFLTIPVLNLLILPVASIGGAVLVLGVLGQGSPGQERSEKD